MAELIQGLTISNLARNYGEVIEDGFKTFIQVPKNDVFRLDVATYLVFKNRNELVTDEDYLDRAVTRVDEARRALSESEE